MDIEQLDFAQRSQPTRAERIRLLQQEADEEVGHIVQEMLGHFKGLEDKMKELATAAKGSRPAIVSLVTELRPQVQRCHDIAKGVTLKGGH